MSKLSSPSDRLDDILRDIATAPHRDTETRALREVIDALWLHLPASFEEDILEALSDVAERAAKWAKEDES